MTVRWSLAELAAIVGADVSTEAQREVRGVSIDSRQVQPGELFVAIVGERVDGHDYVDAAFDGGAAAALVDTRFAGEGPLVRVPDTIGALRELAIAHRPAINVPVIAVTGSTGKTTTKDLLAAGLDGSWASPLSYNNEIGVPLTVLATPDKARYVVVEVGSRGIGNIEWLMPSIRPAVAVITNLGVVHLETFGTEDNLALAKWELVDGLDADGTAILPVDEPRLGRAFAGRTITFGEDPDADVSASKVVLGNDGVTRFELRTMVGSVSIEAPLPGRHQPTNIAAAVAAAIAVEAPLDGVIAGIEQAKAAPWRMEIHRGSFTVVNDAYNANPDSVESALRTVAELPGRHIAVLGEMAELGHVAEREHLRIGALASSLGYAAVVTVGDEPGIARGAGAIARRVTDPGAAAAVLTGYVRPGDVVLVKASRSVGLETLAQQLVEEATA